MRVDSVTIPAVAIDKPAQARVRVRVAALSSALLRSLPPIVSSVLSEKQV